MGQVIFHVLPQDDEHAAWAAITGRPRLAVAPEPGVWGKDAMHALTSTGGFSMRDHLGDAPKDGYMVSVNKDAERTIPIRELTPDHIRQFRDDHADLLADPANYLGGWEHEGNVYLDVSRHEPDLTRAQDLARQHQQLGIYDIANGKTLMTDGGHQMPAAATLHFLPGDDLGAVNALRAASSLPPLTPASGLLARRAALYLVANIIPVSDSEHETHVIPMAWENWMSAHNNRDPRDNDDDWREMLEWADILRQSYDDGEQPATWRSDD